MIKKTAERASVREAPSSGLGSVIAARLNSMTDVERTIFRAHFMGNGDGKTSSFEEIGKRMKMDPRDVETTFEGAMAILSDAETSVDDDDFEDE